jgi:flagellar motor switch protein FliM
VQHAKQSLVATMEANLSSSFQFCFPCISVLPIPSLLQLSSQTKGKIKAANTREFRKRSEQKASKNQTPSLLS